MKYRLRTLMIVMMVLPPAIAGSFFLWSWLVAPPQTLPLSFGFVDDVHYFAAGPEFKLSREAAALKASKVAEERTMSPGDGSPVELPPDASAGR